MKFVPLPSRLAPDRSRETRRKSPSIHQRRITYLAMWEGNTLKSHFIHFGPGDTVLVDS